MTASPVLNEGSPSHKHGGVTLRGPVHRINLLQGRRGAASRWPPGNEPEICARPRNRTWNGKREGSEKALPRRCRSFHAGNPGDIPTPPRATTKLFERNSVYQ